MSRPVGSFRPLRPERPPIVILLILLSLSATGRAQPVDQCALPPDLVGPALRIEPRTSDCAAGDPCATELVNMARALADEHPDLVQIQRSYQDLARAVGGAGFDEVRDRFRRRLDEHPDDAASIYLAARITDEGLDAARTSYQRAVELDPDFPWSHLGLAVSSWLLSGRHQESGAGPDAENAAAGRELARHHMDEFMRLCPDRFEEPLANSRSNFGPDYWRPHVARFRTLFEAAPDRVQVAFARDLWALEFATSAVSEHDAVRRRIAADLTRIAGMNLTEFSTWWDTLEEGYRLDGDDEQLDRVVAMRAQTDPCAGPVVASRMQDLVSLPDDPDERLAEFERISGLSEQCPEAYPYCATAFQLSTVIELPEAQRVAVMDRYLDCWEANRDRMRTAESPYLKVAREMLDRGIETERVPGLIALGAEEAAAWEDGQDPENVPEQMRAMMIVSRYAGRVSRACLLGRARLALGDPAGAAESVRQAEDELAELELSELDPEPGQQQIFTGLRGAVSRLRGRVAEAEGRPLDAVADYLEAARMGSDADGSRSDAQRIWAELGGSPASFERIAAAPEPEPEIVPLGMWTEDDRPLPDFDLEDLDGGRWTLDRLKGKTTVVNLWATWCGPCKVELPHLQEVYEAFAEREDAQVLTLNLDRNLGLVAPFLERNGYAFPVCPANDFVDATVGGTAIPQTWIVDRDGVIRFSQGGFSPAAAEQWVDEVVAKVDELARR